MFISSYLISLIAFWVYIGITNDFKQITLLLSKDIITLLVLVVISALISFWYFNDCQTKTEHLAKREIPFKKFRMPSIGTRIMSIILALLIVPSTHNIWLTFYSSYLMSILYGKICKAL